MTIHTLAPNRLATPATLRIYWFPHAGSRVASYGAFRRLLPASVEQRLVEYPGHGTGCEPLQRSMNRLVDAILANETFTDSKPFAFIGHSMGALTAFSVAAELARQRQVLPAWLCVSGCNGPEVSVRRSLPLSDGQLLARLRALGGTPEALLGNEVLRERHLEVLRADLKVCESFRAPEMRLPVPMTAYYGKDDPWTHAEAVWTWSWWTSAAAFTVRRFDGKHFFPFERRGQFAAAVERDLAALGLAEVVTSGALGGRHTRDSSESSLASARKKDMP